MEYARYVVSREKLSCSPAADFFEQCETVEILLLTTPVDDSVESKLNPPVKIRQETEELVCCSIFWIHTPAKPLVKHARITAPNPLNKNEMVVHPTQDWTDRCMCMYIYIHIYVYVYIHQYNESIHQYMNTPIHPYSTTSLHDIEIAIRYITFHSVTWHNLIWHNISEQSEREQNISSQQKKKTYMHARVHTYTHAFIHTVHTYIHTYIHT